MERFVLTDAGWAKRKQHCLEEPSDALRSGADDRLFVEALLRIARTRSPWRDLPRSFGKWNSVHVRFRNWARAAVFQRFLDVCSDGPGMEDAMVDAAIVKGHRHGQGAKRRPRSEPSAALGAV